MSDSDIPQARRPILVWIIFLFYLVSSIQVIVGMFFIAAGGVDMSPEQQAMLAQFTMFDRVIGYVNAAVTLVGVTLLLVLRHQAVSVLAVAFALNLFSTAVVWYRLDIPANTSFKGQAAQIFGIVIFGAVVFYAWRLDRRGILSAAGLSRARPRK
jgi:hypothetical protein